MNSMKNQDIMDAAFEISDADFPLDEFNVYIQANLDDEVVKHALKTGVDLRNYAKQINSELCAVENASIQDYIKESENIASLHKQITNCDNILGRMESMLTGFQTHLGSISGEIRDLQLQSTRMNVQLRNQQKVRGELSQFVDEIVIPECMINHIVDTPVTEREFIEQLHELNHKMIFIREQSFKDTKATLDVIDILDKLKAKAINKIRTFLLAKIYQFRKPMSNYQVPQNSLLQYRFFNEFLMTNERHIAVEIRDEYVNTMSKIYFSYFKSYVSKIAKLQFEEVADCNDLMGIEDTAKKGLFSFKTTLRNRSTTFTLGNRALVLNKTAIEAPVIVPHSASKADTKYSFEAIFRSHQYALVDNACREFLFIGDFFIVTAGSATYDLFNSILGKTLTMFMKNLETEINDCYDCIGIFLCVQLLHRYRILMHERCVPVMDRYWDAVLDLLKPRFEFVLQLNIQSIKNCDPSRLGTINTSPHYISRRFAEFSAAIVGLNETFPSEHVSRLMFRLQASIDDLLSRMASEFVERRKQLVFLINNYDMILTTMIERTTEDLKEIDHLRNLLETRMQQYTDDMLAPRFAGIILFVKESNIPTSLSKIQEERVIALVRNFNTDWKASIEQMNSEVMKTFSNFTNGTKIIQGILTQLIQHYHQFQTILSNSPYKSLVIRSELINVHSVMVEVKKYKPTF